MSLENTAFPNETAAKLSETSGGRTRVALDESIIISFAMERDSMMALIGRWMTLDGRALVANAWFVLVFCSFRVMIFVESGIYDVYAVERFSFEWFLTITEGNFPVSRYENLTTCVRYAWNDNWAVLWKTDTYHDRLLILWCQMKNDNSVTIVCTRL